eukprot:TRINITY_DN10792_c0_g1_i1.p1 TRINITY_DN10792_c0_g1~~TRINITY_DN10792_c0_g1_i1.p1  ORF type:complete len:274 (+),score=56.97 TRINITY_DN10792_c0_g1_i1:55-876(+)
MTESRKIAPIAEDQSLEKATVSSFVATGVMKLIPGYVAERAIVVGDPKRANFLASLLEDPKCVAKCREFYTYTGTYKGKKITVASHGIGGGGASMCFEELIKAGVKVMIRAGTCGSIQPQYREASLIVATGAVRSDGVTDRLIPREYPACADFRVLNALVNQLKYEKSKDPSLAYAVGLCTTEGPFYDGPLGNKNDFWRKAGVLAIEMEVSVLYVIASLRGIQAGAILNVDNYIFQRLETGTYNPHRGIVQKGIERMCQIALDAIVNIAIEGE